MPGRTENGEWVETALIERLRKIPVGDTQQLDPGGPYYKRHQIDCFIYEPDGVTYRDLIVLDQG